MAFDPSVPAVNADLDADPVRNNFNELKALIDAIPPTPQITSGSGVLDGSGILDLSGVATGTYAVGSWYNTPGTGQILTLAAPLRIASSAGAADAGGSACWISY